MSANRRPFRRLSMWMTLAVIPLMLPLASASAQGGSNPDVTVIASGLNNPRGLDWIRGHNLFVAEAGKGGSAPCGPGALGEMCVGRTGRITHVRDGELDRLARLSSIALPNGTFAFGPHDVAVGDGGALFATVGSAADREQFGPKAARLSTLVRVTRNGDVTVVADLLAYEAEHNPDGGPIESDPYGLLRRGSKSIVTDAAGNSLLGVSDGGRVSTLAVFPDRRVEFQGGKVPMDAVPTTVVRGPDGAYYVGQLTGFPFPVHGARVYRVEPGEKPEVFARGFTNIIDIAFDGQGNLYVLEIAHNSLEAAEPFGALLRLSPDGSKSIVLDEGLAFPTSVALSGNNRIFVTNCGICPGGGEILQIDL